MRTALYALPLLTISVGALVAARLWSFDLPRVLLSALLLVAGLTVLPILVLRPDLSLLCCIFCFALQRSPELPVVGDQLTLSEPFLLIAVAGWLAQRGRSAARVVVNASGLIGAFVFYVLVALLSLVSLIPKANISAGFTELAARFYLMFLLVVIASYGAISSNYRRILWAWLLSGLLIGAMVPIYVLGAPGLAVGVKFIALFRNPNALAGYVTGTVLAVLPLALCIAPGQAFTRLRTLTRLVIPLLLLALIFADSQGGLLAVVVSLFAWPVLRLSARNGPLVILTFLIATVVAIFVTIGIDASEHGWLARSLSTVGYESSRVPGRVKLVKDQLDMLLEHPLTGVGIGQAKAYSAAELGDVEKAKESHFTLVGILAETGILGAFAVTLILASLLRSLARNASPAVQAHAGWRAINEGLTLAFLGMLIFGLAHDVQTNRIMWLVLALIVSLEPACHSDRDRGGRYADGAVGDLAGSPQSRQTQT